jgi:hypothetical protein
MASLAQKLGEQLNQDLRILKRFCHSVGEARRRLRSDSEVKNLRDPICWRKRSANATLRFAQDDNKCLRKSWKCQTQLCTMIYVGAGLGRNFKPCQSPE